MASVAYHQAPTAPADPVTYEADFTRGTEHKPFTHGEDLIARNAGYFKAREERWDRRVALSHPDMWLQPEAVADMALLDETKPYRHYCWVCWRAGAKPTVQSSNKATAGAVKTGTSGHCATRAHKHNIDALFGGRAGYIDSKGNAIGAPELFTEQGSIPFVKAQRKYAECGGAVVRVPIRARGRQRRAPEANTDELLERLTKAEARADTLQKVLHGLWEGLPGIVGEGVAGTLCKQKVKRKEVQEGITNCVRDLMKLLQEDILTAESEEEEGGAGGGAKAEDPAEESEAEEEETEE